MATTRETYEEWSRRMDQKRDNALQWVVSGPISCSTSSAGTWHTAPNGQWVPVNPHLRGYSTPEDEFDYDAYNETKRREEGMNHSLTVFLINDHARAMLCTYHREGDPELKGGDAPRTMFKTLDPSIKVGDYVVIPTESRHKMTVVQVAEVDVDPDFDSHAEVKWIIGRVDRADHEHLLALEAEAIKRVKHAEALAKRKKLAENLAGLDAEQLKALPIADLGGSDKPAE